MTTPVIYLYPKQKTEVNVSIATPGVIYASGPTYPTGGWKHVTAEPSGQLSYQDETYSSLFYEFYVKQPPSPTKGIILSTVELKPQLANIMTRYGLNEQERKEFIDTWLPQLYQLHAPYIFFSLFDQEAKNKFDRVSVLPQPDTTIYLFTYFKPLYSYLGFPHETLSIPVSPPSRSGFTAVEWGASINDLP